VVLDRSGHWPFVDDLEGVAGPVLEFLREVTGRSGGYADDSFTQEFA
jgi:hypothetical protein